MKLIISEKPDLARKVAGAIGATTRENGYYIGNGYIVAHSIGHIFEMLKPDELDERYKKWNLNDLPIIPKSIPKRLKPEFQKQYNIIRDLARRQDVDVIINNGDSDAEGQLLIQEILDSIKNKKPVFRLWNSSMDPNDIRKAVKAVKPDSEYQGLLHSAEARSELDWLVGMNLSRLMSIKGNEVLPVGRVQTPLLNFICRRAEQVEHYNPIPYYVLTAADQNISLLWHTEDGANQFQSKASAEKMKAKVNGKTGLITSVKQSEEKVSKPNIYDTNSLQADADKMYGYSASDTLDVLEELYMAGITSYPRTDCCYLLQNMQAEFDAYIDVIAGKNPVVTSVVSKMKAAGFQNQYIFNDKKVEEHTGIILTPGYTNCNPSSLSDKQQKILSLIVTRMLEVCAPASTYDKLIIDAEIEGELFSNTETSMKRKGFLIFREKLLGRTPKISKTLSTVTKGDSFTAETTEVLEKLPAKPHYYTEAELIMLMQNVAREAPEEYRKVLRDAEGLGTGATRGAIIKNLITSRYVEKKGKGVVPTEKGRYLISAVTEEMKSPVFTAKMEAQLSLIRKEQRNKSDFMAETKMQLQNMVTAGKTATIVPMKSRTHNSASGVVVGKCPRCGQDVVESAKAYSCVGYKNKSCSFAIWKDNKFFESQKKKLTTTIIKALLSHGKAHVTGLTSSKSGKKYDADIILDCTGTFVNFKLDFSVATPRKAKSSKSKAAVNKSSKK